MRVLDSPLSFKLPPYPYTLYLLDQFNTYIGHDYHWFLQRRSREQLDITYSNPNAAESKSRIWLCRLLVVFALGESYNSARTPHIRLDSNIYSDDYTSPPPGTEFFEYALMLLKVPYEEPTIEYVEVLNLIVSYSLAFAF